jgi:hypothetical protein
MRTRLFASLFAIAVCLSAAAPAQAVICYIVYNKGDSVIYQDTYAPVDMSSAGTPEREAMQRRGEHMTFGDIAECPRLVFLTGTGGVDDMGVDAVLSNLPGTGGITTKMGMMGGKLARDPGTVAAPAATPAAKGAKGS